MSDSSVATADQARGLWWSIILITGAASLGLNITHAVVYEGSHGAAITLSTTGRVVLAVIASIMPVLMAALLCHAFVVDAPGPVRLAVGVIFLLGMAMSLTAQVELLTPIIGGARALGTAVVIDAPALISLIMIERGNRARKEARRRAEARAQAKRQADEQARRERLAAERQAAEQAAAERLARAQQAAEQAAAERAEIERQAAAELADAERQAAARAESEHLTAAELAEAERLALARADAERAAAQQTAEAERERAERLRAAQQLAAEQRAAERERAQREEAERAAEARRLQAEQAARAEAQRARRERAELAARGDLSPDRKREIIRAAWEANPGITGTDAAAAVVAEGGSMSDARARAVLADIRRQASADLAKVHPLRSGAAV
ncbi:hypothetical protein ACBI99_44605 [Nonomuraea sp. ATR24]|uniref:hypothetical protein n=1 Tax=Nonomuraea sp. ATR24 TaxID=1676744 RepID=UPI0035BF07DB